MTFAIKWGSDDPNNQGLIYFDAVTAYSENHMGQVTRHPVDTGGKITDHFVKENSKYNISAVITGVDLSTGSYLIQDGLGNYPFNTNIAPSAVSINSTDKSVLSKFIPDSIGQFLSNSSPDVVMDAARVDIIDQVKFFLIDLMSGVKFNSQTNQFDSNIQIVELFQFEGTLLTDIIFDLVLTNISFEEKPETGRALYCNLVLEQVQFVTLQKTEIPITVTTTLSKKTASKKTQTKCDSTIKDSDSPPEGEDSPDASATDISPSREAIANG